MEKAMEQAREAKVAKLLLKLETQLLMPPPKLSVPLRESSVNVIMILFLVLRPRTIHSTEPKILFLRLQKMMETLLVLCALPMSSVNFPEEVMELTIAASALLVRKTQQLKLIQITKLMRLFGAKSN